MKKYILAALLVLSFLVVTAQSETMTLNGEWKFKAPAEISWGAYNNIKSGFSTSSWDSLQVPGNWEVENNYANFVGEAAYSKTFELPQSFKSGELFINFDAVYYQAKVFLNGNYLGKHEGGYTPFQFCISDMVKKDKPNVLVVLANNEFSRGAWWSWGGISREVKLLRYEEVKLNQFHISAIPDFKTGITTVQLNSKIENLKSANPNLDIEIQFDNNLHGIEKQSSKLNSFEVKTFSSSFTIPTKDVKLWHFDRPNLYTATINVYSNKQLTETKKIRFGIRKVEVRGTQFLINNEPVRAFGFNRVADDRIVGNTEPIELIKRDIDDLKSLGCVLTRMIHYPQSPELLDYCDEKGMLIISEIPVWGKFDPNSYAENPTTKHWLNEMVERDFNHPSIIGWSLSNELGIDVPWKEMRMSKEQFRYVASMIRHIKTALDTTRLITYSSFTSFREQANPDNEPASLCDFISINSYGDILANVKEVHRKWNDKPIFISEFGRGQIGENLNTSDLLPVVVDLVKEAQKLPYLMGASLWSYNDYRSKYLTGTPPSENRSWGVVDVWRNKKKSYRTIQKLFSPVKDFKVEINGNKATISFFAKAADELPSFELKNYSIDFVSPTDKKQSFDLPEIKPNGMLHTQTVELKKELLKENFILIQLSSPTGSKILKHKIALTKMKAPELLHNRMNKEKMQVEFSEVPAASKYLLKYNNSTIELLYPKFEIAKDSAAQTHSITLYAYDDNGNFSTSKSLELKTEDIILPPVIQSVIKTINSYTIGFTVEKNDQNIEIEYTTKSGSHLVSSKLKGSIKIYEKEIQSIRIRKTDNVGTSVWSEYKRILN